VLLSAEHIGTVEIMRRTGKSKTCVWRWQDGGDCAPRLPHVKRWGNAAIVLRWTAASMMEAAKGYRRLKAYKHLPALKVALASLQLKHTVINTLEEKPEAA
jgi:hypothetical protein